MSRETKEIQLTIDGREIIAREGDTVLEVARKAGVEIPTVCDHPELEPSGACRLCVVEIEGTRGFPTSCTTPAADGMLVRTDTPEVAGLRRNVLKLMLSGHTSPCIVCLHRELCEKYRPNPTKAGKATRCGFCNNRQGCDLRTLAKTQSVDDLGLPIIYNNMALERIDPFMDRDYNLCVLCGKCVRVCAKLHGKAAIDFIGRGKDARIGTAFHRDHTESACLFCGACIDICETGALADRFAKWRGTEDSTQDTTCILCPLGCSLRLKVKGDKVIASSATAFSAEARICAIGRFVLPQMLEHSARLTSHSIRIVDGLRRASYEESVADAAEKLAGFSGSRFALVTHPSATREEIYVARKFTTEVMKSDNFMVVTNADHRVEISPAVEALFATGDYVAAEVLQNLDVTVVADVLPSGATEAADVVFGASFLAETDGTFLTASGEVRELSAGARPPEDVFPDWRIICDVARAMGSSGFDFDSPAEIRRELEAQGIAEQPPRMPDPSPLDDITALPRMYRGHPFAEFADALKSLLPEQCQLGAKAESQEPKARQQSRDHGHRQLAEVAATGNGGETGFEIVEKVELAPNTHMIAVRAPMVAEKCMPGQFVIAMVNEKSERIPYTIADWDAAQSTVTINVLEAGRSSHEMTMLGAGDRIAHFAGPLGTPIEVKKYGTVVCGGGCYGVGAMLPIARALREVGNKVICIEEACSEYSLYWQDRLSENCDELLIATKDGSVGTHGGVQEVISMLVERGEKIDQSFIVGCTFMMMLVCETTKEHGIPTLTALNPLMLDGTGMCGACRVTVGDKTKFACVDGPFFDGHQIDWVELMQRRSAYHVEEIQALPQDHSMHALHERMKD